MSNAGARAWEAAAQGFMGLGSTIYGQRRQKVEDDRLAAERAQADSDRKAKWALELQAHGGGLGPAPTEDASIVGTGQPPAAFTPPPLFGVNRGGVGVRPGGTASMGITPPPPASLRPTDPGSDVPPNPIGVRTADTPAPPPRIGAPSITEPLTYQAPDNKYAAVGDIGYVKTQDQLDAEAENKQADLAMGIGRTIHGAHPELSEEQGMQAALGELRSGGKIPEQLLTPDKNPATELVMNEQGIYVPRRVGVVGYTGKNKPEPAPTAGDLRAVGVPAAAIPAAVRDPLLGRQLMFDYTKQNSANLGSNPARQKTMVAMMESADKELEGTDASLASAALTTQQRLSLAGDKGGLMGGAIGDILRGTQSPEQQIAAPAMDNFVAETAHYITGARISDQQLGTYRRIFSPQPGDGIAAIQAKAARRKAMIQAAKGGLLSGTPGPNGEPDETNADAVLQQIETAHPLSKTPITFPDDPDAAAAHAKQLMGR